MPALAEKALQPVLDGRIKIHPEERFLNTYKYWLGNIRDWCIQPAVMVGTAYSCMVRYRRQIRSGGE
jgi:valyl-tRNA synthetase